MSWLSGWTHRKKVDLYGGISGAQSDYQIKIEIDYVRHMQKDFSDIRFTQSDGVTLINTWLESSVDGTSSTVWAKFPATPPNGETVSYYMYYGSPDALHNWDGDATFLQYMGSTSSNFNNPFAISPTNIAFEAKVKRSGSSVLYYGMSSNVWWDKDNMYIVSNTAANKQTLYSWNNGSLTSIYEGPVISDNTWAKLLITFDGATVYGYVDGNEIGSGGISTNLPDENLGIGYKNAGGTGYQEYSFARKHVNYPSTYTFGHETIDPTTTLNRSKARFTTPYNVEEGSNIDKLMQVWSVGITDVSKVSDDIIAAHQLSEATGHSLDQWGSLLQVQRTVAETNAHYRARLVSYALMYRRSATPQHMVSNCAEVLGVDTSRITFSDGSGVAAFNLIVFLSDVVGAGLTLSDYVDIMSVSKPGGVTMSLLSSGSFECKGISGGHDATKGYNNIANANPDGGVYAGLIGVV